MASGVAWVCDHCGTEGRTPEGAPGGRDVVPDEIQCPVCGEPVTPLT